MHGVLRNAKAGRRFLQRLDMPWLPHCGRETQANYFALLAAPESRHEEDVGANAGLTQRDGFIQRSDAEPARTLCFESPRAFEGTVSVGVCFHHGTDGDF